MQRGQFATEKVHWTTRLLLSDKLVGRMTDREEEINGGKEEWQPKWMEFCILEGRGRRRRRFIPAVHISLWQMVGKQSEHVTRSDVGRRTRSSKGTPYQCLADKKRLTVLFCPHTWHKYHPASTFLFMYNSLLQKRKISNMDYSTSAAARWMNALNPKSKYGNASFHEALRV